MRVEKTKLDGLLILHPQVFGDERGWFMESFNQQSFEAALKALNFADSNLKCNTSVVS